MTEPMSTGCIKEHHARVQPPSRKVDLDDEIGHFLLSISNLIRKELLNASTCIMKFCHPSLKSKKF